MSIDLGLFALWLVVSFVAYRLGWDLMTYWLERRR